MESQFKKGVLELIVLSIVKKESIYGYKLVEEVSLIIDVNEGTIYPILRRLTNEKYFDTYLEESSSGPPRKYYKINEKGIQRRRELYNEWATFNDKVTSFLKENVDDKE